jgi:hypothetical protein
MSDASVERARLHFDEREVVTKVMGVYADVARRKGLLPALVARWGVSPPV